MSDHRQVCVFCRVLGHNVEADGQLRAYTVNTLVGTPMDEDVPETEVGACAEHLKAVENAPGVDDD